MNANIEQETKQIREWKGEFGREYSDRNTLDPDGVDALWVGNYGQSRTDLNRKFLAGVPLDARILEVGCNVGNQLLLLHGMGYRNLSGIEIQSYAVRLARERVPGASIHEGSALDIPHGDGDFDLVFTSGVLIHIAPADLSRALSEIHRVSRRWIWGAEYYSPSAAEIKYRGHEELLWKDDFCRRYLDQFPDLQLLQEERLPYVNSPNVDTMFLLQRTPQAVRAASQDAESSA